MFNFKLIMYFSFPIGIFPSGSYVNPGIIKAKMYVFISPPFPPLLHEL